MRLDLEFVESKVYKGFESASMESDEFIVYETRSGLRIFT